jgi:hypothetical protein
MATIANSERVASLNVLYRVPFYPYLIGLFHVLTIYVNNATSIGIINLLRPAIIIMAFIALVQMGLFQFYKDNHRAGFVCLIIFFYLFVYGHAITLIQSTRLFGFTIRDHLLIFITVSLIATFLVSPYFWKKISNKMFITTLFNLITCISLIFPIYKIINYQVSFYNSPLYGWNPPQSENMYENYSVDGVTKPDIYYIILDAYARGDVLREIYDFDNTNFYNFLKGKNFFIAEDSYTNYLLTRLSISSSLNMNYLYNLNPYSVDNYSLDQLKRLIHYSEVRFFLEREGYNIITLDSGMGYTSISESDLYFTKFSQLKDFDALLLSASIFRFVDYFWKFDIPFRTHETHRDRINYTFEKFLEIPAIPGPKFIFVHIISPHPPFIFDENGNYSPPKVPYTEFDGDMFPGTKEDYRDGYLNSILFINSKMEEIIEAILDNSTDPPIIIIQSDHGPRMHMEFSSYNENCVRELAPILNAYHLPDYDTTNLYHSISPVNSFRIIFNHYFSTDFPILEDITYSVRMDRSNRLIELPESDRMSCVYK